MNTSKLLATAIAAASIVGGVGFAYAQTTPNDTTAQSRPADQGTPAAPMDATAQPKLQSPQPMDSTERIKQPQNLRPGDGMAEPNVQSPQPMDSTERMKQPQNSQAMPSDGTMQPNLQSPQPLDSTQRAPTQRSAPSAAPATTPMTSDSSAMPAGTERAPQADRN